MSLKGEVLWTRAVDFSTRFPAPTCPAGIIISTARDYATSSGQKRESTKELLQASRDFVKAHRSLCYDGEILHGDISENNIIITDAEDKPDPRGMLIDLDLAKELNGGPSRARHRTGTMEFMAVEVLLGGSHTIMPSGGKSASPCGSILSRVWTCI
ncbi:hypothetical protein DFH27DRAFT_650196 [Peziza echinospora]|nr:hypothetical protein DFH27DRAFT_650196 [Peziza echinospora]